MLIASAKIMEHEGSILPYRLYERTARVLVTRVRFIYLVDESLFLFLV